MTDTLSQPPERAEGDVNLSPRRKLWSAQHLDDATRAILDEDAELFIHQSLSTPCLNALQGSDGIYLNDTQGRKIMDFHGNSVHQVGHGHPRVIEAIKAQLDQLPFCPRRYTNQVAIDLARRLAPSPGFPFTPICPSPLYVVKRIRTTEALTYT
jgi:4-aminobutyrate aminotransferase